MTMHLENRLQNRAKVGNLRSLKVIEAPIDFASNDYLGLARLKELQDAFFQEWQEHASALNGLGSTGSRLLTGNSLYAEALEEKIARFHGYEAGLLFGCGYMANVGLLTAITNEESIILYDAAVHASTHDGIRLCRAKAFPFRHNDLEHLEKRLKNCLTTGDRFICIESIYSTNGSFALLPEVARLAREYGAHLIVDEAHAVGIFGAQGRGLVSHYNLTSQVFVQVTTFGKAVGAYGAIILGSPTLKQALINFSNPYIYTTAPPFQILAAIKCSYDLFPKMDRERIHLKKLIDAFRTFYPNGSMSPIQSIPIQGNQEVKLAAEALTKLGFDIRALTSPTVKKGEECLRICLHSFNTQEEVAELAVQVQRHV